MQFYLEAACTCNIGKVRANNEDNFLFDHYCLEKKNYGLRRPMFVKKKLCSTEFFAVFDGMGGESYGEVASYVAAAGMKQITEKHLNMFMPKSLFLEKLCLRLNSNVLEKRAGLSAERIGTTMVTLCIQPKRVYICNLGDSRAYCLRDGVLRQLSKDHVLTIEGISKKKPSLTQHLGVPQEEFVLEPYIVSENLKSNDQYLLCSDGLTDMLNNREIEQILAKTKTSVECVQQLVDAALLKGGRDNITVIVCRV